MAHVTKPEDYIYNESTRRFILKSSPLGKKLIKAGMVIKDVKPYILTESRRKAYLQVDEMTDKQVNDIYDQLVAERIKRVEKVKEKPVEESVDVTVVPDEVVSKVSERSVLAAKLAKARDDARAKRLSKLVQADPFPKSAVLVEKKMAPRTRKFKVVDTTTSAVESSAVDDSDI